MSKQVKIWAKDVLLEKLRQHKPTAIAQATGLSYQTVLLFFKHPDRDVSYSTIKALSDYLDNWSCE